MQMQEVRTDRTLRELTPRGTPAFPVAMYQNNIAEFITHRVPWHWHREAEVGYLLRGGLLLEWDGQRQELTPGDGFFVNSNRLHAMTPTQPGPCETVNIIFDTEIIAGAPHSVYAQKYVLPLVTNPAVSVLPLTPDQSWQQQTLELLAHSFTAQTQSARGFELQVRSLLSQAWLLLSAQVASQVPATAQDPRIKELLTFLHQHYAEPLTLSQLAASAGMGERTCSRCFQRQLGITPFGYLLEYRVKMAAELLRGTAASVTEICFATGFGDASYFTKIFRRLTGYTPTQFRAIPPQDEGAAPQ